MGAFPQSSQSRAEFARPLPIYTANIGIFHGGWQTDLKHFFVGAGRVLVAVRLAAGAAIAQREMNPNRANNRQDD
jgi:hypothetical protein